MRKLILVFLAMPFAASADPITFTFDMPEFTTGDFVGLTSVLEVTADNGGSSAADQSWLNREIVGLWTDLTGAATQLYYSGTATVLTTDAQGVATLNFEGLGYYIYAIGQNPINNVQIQLFSEDYEYYIRIGSNYGAAGWPQGSPWPVTSRAAAVPEPGTLALLGIGLLGVGLARRRKQP